LIRPDLSLGILPGRRHPGRKIMGRDHRPVTQNDGTLDHVGQFPYVSRPCIGAESLLGLGTDRGDRLLGLPREPAEEEPGELEDVVAALA